MHLAPEVDFQIPPEVCSPRPCYARSESRREDAVASGEQRATRNYAEVACSAPPRRSGRRILGTYSAAEEEDKKAVPSKPRKVTPKAAMIGKIVHRCSNDPMCQADYKCCGVRGALVVPSEEVLTETPQQPKPTDCGPCWAFSEAGAPLCPVSHAEGPRTADFELEAERIRIACVAERLEAEARTGRPGAPLLVADKPLVEASAQRQLLGAGGAVDGNELKEHNMTED